MWAVAFLRKSGGSATAVRRRIVIESVIRAAKRSLEACVRGGSPTRVLCLFSIPLVLLFRRVASAGTGRPVRDQWRTHMAKTRALSIVVTLGLALVTTASPAAAYIEALTSTSADAAADKATLEKAIQAAVVDVATHAVAFTPTVVSLRDAKLVGGRIYLFVLLADAAGEAELEVMKAASARPSLDRR
jgi:hypothetical protein